MTGKRSSLLSQVHYVTAFEGSSEGNFGLYKSQVLDFIEEANNIKKDVCELIAFLSSKQNSFMLENECKQKGIRLKVVKTSEVVRYYPYYFMPENALIPTVSATPKIFIGREIVATYFAKCLMKGMRQRKNASLLIDKRGLPELEVFSFKNKPIWFKLLKYSILLSIQEKTKKDIIGARFVSKALKQYVLDKNYLSDDIESIVQPTMVKKKRLDRSKNSIPEIDEKLINVTYIGGGSDYQKLEEIIDYMRLIAKKNLHKVQPIVVSNFKNEEEVVRTKRRLGRMALVFNKISNDKVLSILKQSDFGIVVRDDVVFNRVSSPVKISEYLMAGVKILYKGNIAVIREQMHRYPRDTFQDMRCSRYLKKVSSSDREQIAKVSDDIFSATVNAANFLTYLAENYELDF